MKMLRQIVLICWAGSVFAQTLPLPPRATNAPGGKFFAGEISALNLAERERRITGEIMAGNVPGFLRTFCPVGLTNLPAGLTNTATFFALPDYLAVGSDADYFLTPLSPGTAQRLADNLGCLLPTRKMVDAIYSEAEVKLYPAPIAPSPAMTTVPVVWRHNEMVRTQRLADPHPPGVLTAGHQKDVVISPRLGKLPNKVAIYGWHDTNGIPIQPLYLGHAASWVDYSQCIRLVYGQMQVDGQSRSVAEVLADPALAALVSDEGVVTNARYPTNAIAVASPRVDLPWPEKFSPVPPFGERIREVDLPEGGRVVINAPAPDPGVSNRPVLLVFYALPNGNSIEQTIGKTLKPGDDWHFNIQHIGAQTRWLRAVLTNRTVVVAYLEANSKSWPAWRKVQDDRSIPGIFDSVRRIFAGQKVEVVLASHSGGGSLIFGYLNAVKEIPDDVVRIAFLDSNYAYATSLYQEKVHHWLTNSPAHHLCVLAYHDSIALLDGKPFVSEQGGTWGRSRVMLNDLRTQFAFASRTNDLGLEACTALDGRIQFLLHENPGRKILHTVQVDRNGFIHALLSGTSDEGRGYEYLGERAYTNWITGD